MPSNSPARRVGLEVRASMVRAGTTQAELAKILSLSQAAVSRRLTGDVPFDVDELAAIAPRLGVSAGDLIGRALTETRAA